MAHVLAKLLAPAGSPQSSEAIPGLQDIPSLPASGRAPPVAPAFVEGFRKEKCHAVPRNGWFMAENPKMDDLGSTPISSIGKKRSI